MQQFMDKFFGPLDVTYCNYFYVISVFGFVAFLMTALNLVFNLPTIVSSLGVYL